VFDAVLMRQGWSPDPGALQRAEEAGSPLDGALILALDVASVEAPGELGPWREALQGEARRRLYPARFGAGEGPVLEVARVFFPLAAAALPALVREDSLAARLPFERLTPAEREAWPSGEDYARLLDALEAEGFLVALAMAQHWRGLTIQDHVLGVTGLALWMGRQLARAIPLDLPLLHGAAIGHDVGKFGCVGDEARRIPRLHYYYTHQYFASRGLGGVGNIATNHSCWDLESIRLPIETQVLIYCDFRVKDTVDGEGRKGMAVISLREAFETILEKLEDVDRDKRRRYQAVYRKLRDLEDYALALGVALDPPGFQVSRRARPRLPEGLDLVALLGGTGRPDGIALAAGPQVASMTRLLATAHTIGVMERLRDLPALERLLEEARSHSGWRELRTYLGIVGDCAPAYSEEQKSLALAFFRELLAHPDDDIRYQAACRMADLLALGEVEWRKDLPEGAAMQEPAWVLPQVAAVMDLLDLAPLEPAEDMAAQERVLYAVPVFLRRFFGRALPALAAEALPLVLSSLEARAGDRRPLTALYVCESYELLAPVMGAPERERLPKRLLPWAFHEVPNVRIMAWRVLHALGLLGRREPALLDQVAACVDALAGQPGPRASVAELFLLEQCALLTGRKELAGRCRDLREGDRAPLREVMLRNLKSQTGWVEKKVACDYLVSTLSGRGPSDAPLAGEVAFHLANLLKVSRVEGTRFHAGRSLVSLLPLLSVTLRNDLAIELLRSLQLDGERVTRYLPRFLGPLLASLPPEELDELVEDMELDARRGTESLQRLLIQAAAWLLIALPAEPGDRFLRLLGILLGALADTRRSVAHEGFAHLALLLDWLRRNPDPRLPFLLRAMTKKVLTLVTHRPGDTGRFLLAAQALAALDRALAASPVAFPGAPRVGLLPGTFDPFTAAHGEIVRRVLGCCDEVFVQVDDFSWRKHAQPRFLRDELAWMALAPLPGAFLLPFDARVNLANPASLQALRARLGRRPLHLVVGSDVLEGASAYRDAASAIWSTPHLVMVREDPPSRHWEGLLQRFTGGVQVLRVPSRVKGVSSTCLREAFDQRGELEAYCDPLIARVLRERRLYLNFPARKEEIFESRWVLRYRQDGGAAPAGLRTLVQLDATRALARGLGRRPRTVLLQARGTGEDLASLTWLEGTASALPVALEDPGLARASEGRLLGSGALVETLGARPGDGGLVHLDQLLSRVLGRWFGEGLLFSLFAVPLEGGEGLWDVLRHHGGGWLGEAAGEGRRVRWAGIELTHPLVMVHDLEQLLQRPYLGSAPVEEAVLRLRRTLSGFFADRHPGSSVLHIHEKETKRQLASWAGERLGRREGGWVVLGLGRQFTRDLVGGCPTLAVDLERFLTPQGREAGVAPSPGSPSLESQLATARELGGNAILLAPFLESAGPVLRVADACRKAGMKVRETLVGTTSASVHASLHQAGLAHRAVLVVPHWRGVLRESAVIPFAGGWSIRGARPGVEGLTPSLNDCLPYLSPSLLGLDLASDPEGALAFSRLALEQAQGFFRVLEEEFRRHEGRLLSLADLSMVVRHPRCPPLSGGFTPVRDCVPSTLIGQDLEALARLWTD
jgi:nicotinic acid mononucleotide adenylyltransferase